MEKEAKKCLLDGIDGLGGIHHSVSCYISIFSPSFRVLTDNQHPHLSPAETWKTLFEPTPENLSPEAAAELQKVKDQHCLFTPSLKPAPEVMLDLLRENEPDTITIVAVGPLTNLAIAAAQDPETFLRVKEVVVMGGAIDAPGNVRQPISFFSTFLSSVTTQCNSSEALGSAHRLLCNSSILPPHYPSPSLHST